MELTKFKLSLLNSVGSYTMFYFHAPLAGVGLANSAIFFFATQTIAMSTQCFGQVNEAEFDAAMARTKNRPMAQHRISAKHACFLGTSLTVSSLVAYHAFMPFTWVVSNAVWFSYLCCYLPLKQKSELNTLVGAVVGALPPFIGTFAQTGTLMDPATFLLASYIFTWQFPHFYGILYEHKEDYKRAGFVMTSNSDPTGRKKATGQILACTLANTAIPVAMAWHGLIHPVFLAPFMATQVNAFRSVHRFYKEQGSAPAAKYLKRSSYPPFLVLLVGFIATTAATKFHKRREQDQVEWRLSPEQDKKLHEMALEWAAKRLS